MIKMCFVGGDKRINYLKKLYEKELTSDIMEADYIIFPIPFSKDGIHITGEDMLIDEAILKCANKNVFSGGISQDIRKKLEENNISYVDLMELDEVAILNAIPTAEGAILKAMDKTEITIHNANVLVLGFGRIGKILANKLKGLNANVFCEARNKKDIAYIKALGYNLVELNNLNSYLGNMDIIFSTIPALILDIEKLKLVKKDAVIIDLASTPGSVDYEAAKELGISSYLELGIPSKVAPYSSAIYLKEAIDRLIEGGQK